MTHHTETADYSKHTDDELRGGIAKAEDNLARIEREGSDQQRQAAEEQVRGMNDELDRRQS